MGPAAKRSGGGVLEGMYRMIMRRTPIYVTFVVVGAFLGERAVDHGVRSLWDHVNAGVCVLRSAESLSNRKIKVVFFGWDKKYEDISVLGQRPTE
ncbi:hypothetical protein RD792_009868 [Penstemon davidsonii]|uniref:Cytochrome b-c1 complex subunit 9 n=1 Tax=Penstemon davidsonii TaxID=160366 RepID=A0ABR0D0A1_9LAMI|nr:hypothetical protein RD792_009868 [Penstemon davidsonii]